MIKEVCIFPFKRATGETTIVEFENQKVSATNVNIFSFISESTTES